MIPKINSAHGSDTRNIINRTIEVLNHLGIDVQTLVAEGQLTEEQYAELITVINGLIKSGHVDKGDLTSEFKDEIEGFSAQLAHKVDKNATDLSINMFNENDRNVLQNQEPGTINAVLGTKNVKRENIADKVVSHEKLDITTLSPNLFDGIYSRGYLSGNIDAPGAYSEIQDRRSIIMQVDTNSIYTISKEISDRFRIALFNQAPTNGMQIDKYVKDEYLEGDDALEYTFNTEDKSYLVIYVSASGEEPYVHVEKGEVSTYNTLQFNKPLKIDQIVKGKNIFQGNYFRGTLPGDVGSIHYISTNNGWVSVEKVLPNTTYSLTKKGGNRFKVGLSNRTDIATVVFDNNEAESTVINTEDNSYMVLYVAFDAEPPHFFQLEESPEPTSLETRGFKFIEEAKPYGVASGFASSRILELLIDARDYGVIGDGIADDTLAMEQLASAGKGRVIYIPFGMTINMRRDWILEAGTHVIARGVKIKLADNYNLSTFNWRYGIQGSSIVRNRVNADRVIIEGLKVEGNKTQLLTTARLCGILLVDTEHSKLIDVTADWINIKDNLTERDWGYNIATLRAKDIDLINCRADYGGYETYGIYDDCEDVRIDGGYAGIGWRTAFQIHRGCKNIKAYKLTIAQDHLEAHSSLTLHGTESKPVENVVLDSITLTSLTDDALHNRGAIQSVEGNEHFVTIVNSDFDTNNQILSTNSDGSHTGRLNKQWIVKDNRFKGKKGFSLYVENSIVKDNIVDVESEPMSVQGTNNKVDNLYTNAIPS